MSLSFKDPVIEFIVASEIRIHFLKSGRAASVPMHAACLGYSINHMDTICKAEVSHMCHESLYSPGLLCTVEGVLERFHSNDKSISDHLQTNSEFYQNINT